MSNEEIVEELQQGIDTTANQERLWEKNSNFVRYKIWQICGYNSEDLEQECFIGLLDAAMAYNPDEGASFRTYANYHIKKAILRYTNDCCLSVRVPVYLRKRIRDYEKLRQQFMNDLHREPTEEEYLEHLNISSRSLANLEKTLHNMKIISLDAEYGEESGKTFEDLLTNDEDIEELITYSVYHKDLKIALDEALSILNDRTASMIRSIYYQERGWAQTAEIFGCSVQNVSQTVQGGFWRILHSKHRKNLESFMHEGYQYNEDLYSEFADQDEEESIFLV